VIEQQPASMRLSLIVAMSWNRVIGRDGGLPWHLSADLQRFKRLTVGHAIIMGRKTFDSIGRILPGRRSIVITRQVDFSPPGVVVAHDVNEAIQQATSSDEAFVIGGEQIFQLMLPLVTRMHITEVQANVTGDTLFPAYDPSEWRLTEESVHAADAKNDYPVRFLVYDRVGRVDSD
jgi:dihydrofolate reductase